MSKDNIIPSLSLFLIASLLVMSIVTYGPVFASNGDEDRDEENGNGNGEEVQTDSVQVSVQRGDNETEEINVTPNITVVVDFENTVVTNETVLVGDEQPPAQGNQTSNQTAPPEQPPVVNQTQGNQTTEPQLPPINQTSNQTAPPQGNETAPTEEPPIETPTTNQTIPPSEVPTENNQTVPVEQPTSEPTAINLALIEDIQRGHIQHVTPFVTDDSGNEFTDESVSITIINQRGITLHDVDRTSGQEYKFKVGPNTSPQQIQVYAVLDSNDQVNAQADYNVFPKPQAQPPTEPIPEPLPPMNETIPVPTVNQTQESNETDVETPFNVTLPNSTFG
jgi:hypothetical protein